MKTSLMTNRIVGAVALGVLLSGAGIGAAQTGSVPGPRQDPPEIVAGPEIPPGDTPAAPLGTAPTTEWTYHKSSDNAHPDANEQQMVWLMNRARTDPAAEGAWLADTGETDIETDIANLGVDLAVMQNEFAAIAAKPPAAFDVRLYNAAYEQSLYQISCNCQSHLNQDQRVYTAGFAFSSLRGSVFAYAKSALHCHAALNIDWAGTNNAGDEYGMQPGRGHRVAIMSIERSYYNVGIAIVPHNGSYPNVGPFVMTGNYAYASSGVNHYNRFIVGTVWNDANCNALYDPGEGIGGVTVQPDHGVYYAVSADSGGYAIPITQEGTYQVTFANGPLAQQVVRTVDLGSYSALLDVNLAALTPGFQVAGATLGSPPFQVAFNDTTGGSVTSWHWDFGDGATSTERHPTHTYTRDGRYTVELTVTGGCGTYSKTASDCVLVANAGADVNGDGTIDLIDPITAFQAATGRGEGVTLNPDGVPDVDGDGVTGTAEAAYILRWLSE